MRSLPDIISSNSHRRMSAAFVSKLRTFHVNEVKNMIKSTEYQSLK